MDYIVLARKWRPQTFAEVIGQEHIIRTLINVIQKKRIAHAYLFVGPRGVGKTSLARILAKALNCEKGPTAEPCQHCSVCKGITEGKSLDVLEIDGASNRGIDEIRQLRENIRFSPTQGKFRIYIIDEVHMLTTPAFNALLKTLEEPPAHVKFILATTAPHQLPTTILSRCQRFNFRLISIKELIDQLKMIAAEENIKISSGALFQIASQAEGSMRDAESILDQLTSFGDKEIKEEDVLTLLGKTGKDIFSKFMDAVLTKSLSEAIKHFQAIMDHGEEPLQLLTDILNYLRHLLFLKIGKEGEDIIEMTKEALDILKRQASHIDSKEIYSLLDCFSSLNQEMRWSSSPRLIMEVALAKASRPNSLTVSPSLAVSPSEPAALNACSPEKLLSSPPASDGLTIEEIRNKWPQAIERIKKEKITLGACLIEGEPIKFHHPVLTVQFEEEFNFHRETVEKPENKKIAAKILSDIFKMDIMVHCLTVESTPAALPSSSYKSPAPAKPHQEIINKTMELFKGKIIERKHVKEKNHEKYG